MSIRLQIFFLFLSYCIFPSKLNAQSIVKLSECVGNDRTQWNDCIGSHSYKDGPRAGRTYTGAWKNGKANGVGTSVGNPGTNISRFDGEFVDDIPNGRGKITSSRGVVYEGDVKDGLPHGVGTYYWLESNEYNGYKYVGEWRVGKRNGKGTLSRGGYLYVGEFKDDVKEGIGSVTEKDGFEYSGEFKKDKFDGMGKALLPNGDRYVGEFKDGKYHGQGTYFFRDSKLAPDSGRWIEGRYMGSQPPSNNNVAGLSANASLGERSSTSETITSSSGVLGKGETRNTGFQDCGVKTSTNLAGRDTEKLAPIVSAEMSEGTKTTIGLLGASVASKNPLTDERLKTLELNKTKYSDVIKNFQSPVSTIKASGKIISTYLSTNSTLTVSPLMFVPIIGILLDKRKMESTNRTVYLIYDENSELLVGCQKMDSNSNTESASVLEMLKNIKLD
jgi:hypothetical protein